MARSIIIVTSEPKGYFHEGIIIGTPKVGICVSLKSTVRADGELEYEPWNGAADGERDEINILLEDWGQGKTRDDAYVTGSRCFMYTPYPGERFMMLAANLTGTGSGTDDAFAIGDKMIIDDGTGKLVKTTGSPEMEPFKVIAAVAAIQADTHILVRYTGH
jgi:hypothetical protein